MEISEELKESLNSHLLLDAVEKQDDKYYVKSYKTREKIADSNGYVTVNQAIDELLKMKSANSFYNKSPVREAVIEAYKLRYSL
tara:strand:- start:1745 stop:1996 length:252 start_codon:yes stop_codon:yes gene_type:complete